MENYKDRSEVIWEGKPSLRGSLSFIGIIGHLITFGISFLIKWFLLRYTDYTITKDHIHVQSGFLSKSDNEIKLYRIRDFTGHQSLWQRIFGFRDITVVSTDRTLPIFKLKAVPEQLISTLRKQTSLAREEQNIQIIE